MPTTAQSTYRTTPSSSAKERRKVRIAPIRANMTKWIIVLTTTRAIFLTIRAALHLHRDLREHLLIAPRFDSVRESRRSTAERVYQPSHRAKRHFIRVNAKSKAHL